MMTRWRRLIWWRMVTPLEPTFLIYSPCSGTFTWVWLSIYTREICGAHISIFMWVSIWIIIWIMIIRIQHYNRWCSWPVRCQAARVHNWCRIYAICDIWVGTTLTGIRVQWTILWLVCRICIVSVWIPWPIICSIFIRNGSIKPRAWFLSLVAIMVAAYGSWFRIRIPVPFFVIIALTSIIIVVTSSSAWWMTIPSRNLLNK